MHEPTNTNTATTTTIAVMGASGHTGRVVAELLLDAGIRVRALGRSATRLADLARRGAEVRIGDAADSAFLTEAFAGAAAAYTLLPTDRTALDYRDAQDRQGAAIAAALRAAGVGHVVALSSFGADLPRPPGPIAGLAAQESRLRALEHAHVLLLRPVSFFENVLDALPLARHAGIFADGIADGVAQPMIAAADIAAVAARALLHRDWRGTKIRELFGPEDHTPGEIARMVGARIGLPELPYVEVRGDALVGALVEAGLSPSFAAMYRDMTEAMNDGTLVPRGHRDPASVTATTLASFADGLAEVFASCP